MSKEFDVIEFEQEREETFKRSQSIYLEISSYHNYSEGITYFTLTGNGIDLGEYYRDPWGDGWYWMSNISGEKAHCLSREVALTEIELAWLRWLR